MYLLDCLREIRSLNISEKIELANNELHDKEWKYLEGSLIGGAVGVATSMIAGPLIGGWIGSIAGLSGAAATSYGLALLGGGSLTSGGFGMAGGSILLGSLFGITGGVKGAKKSSAVNELEIMQADQLLPILLAIGRCMYEFGNEEIPDLIHKTISKRLKDKESRYDNLSKKRDKENMEKTIALYKKAEEMSEPEGWISDDGEFVA